MNDVLVYTGLPVAAYLLGAIPFALILGAMAGVDLRRVGTGNVGAGNLTRVVGVYHGAAAAVLDGLKGLVPVVVARRLGFTEGIAAASGIAAVIGHNWSIYLRGRAGRGLATASGVLVALAPGLLVWTAFWAVAGWRLGGGLGGFIGWGMLGPVAYLVDYPAVVVTTVLLLGAIVIVRRVQGNPDSSPGVRAALHRAVWDTDQVREVGAAGRRRRRPA